MTLKFIKNKTFILFLLFSNINFCADNAKNFVELISFFGRLGSSVQTASTIFNIAANDQYFANILMFLGAGFGVFAVRKSILSENNFIEAENKKLEAENEKLKKSIKRNKKLSNFINKDSGFRENLKSANSKVLEIIKGKND